MLFRLISLVLFLLLAAAGANWLAGQPGQLRLEWLDWRVEIRTSVAVVILVVAAGLLIFADRLWRKLVNLPFWLGRSVKQRRQMAGHKALTLGLMAVSAGEAHEAKRQAKRAQRLLDAPKLTTLLSAQAAHLAGDHRAAERYFQSLTKSTDTAFLGHIGLARLAHDGLRPDDALENAKKAFLLKPKSVMAAALVLDLETARSNWAAAAPALEVIVAAKDPVGTPATDPYMRNRQKAALAFLQAEPNSGTVASQNASDGPLQKKAVRLLETAMAADPTFWPAVLLLADHYLRTKNRRKASRLLEASFCMTPHTALAARLKEAWNINEGAYVGKLIKLVTAKGSASDRASVAHEQATIVAEISLSAGIEGEARRLLESIPDTDKDVTAWQLVARLAHLAGDDAAATNALRHAGDAPRPSGWQCANCNVLSAEWHSHCNACNAFAALIWQRPSYLTPLGKDSPAATQATPAMIASGD